MFGPSSTSQTTDTDQLILEVCPQGSDLKSDHGTGWSPGILCLLMARAPSGVLDPAECLVYGPSSEMRSDSMRSTSEALFPVISFPPADDRGGSGI